MILSRSTNLHKSDLVTFAAVLTAFRRRYKSARTIDVVNAPEAEAVNDWTLMVDWDEPRAAMETSDAPAMTPPVPHASEDGDAAPQQPPPAPHASEDGESSSGVDQLAMVMSECLISGASVQSFPKRGED